MILLALDTCDSRGSLAVFRDDELLLQLPHQGAADYSSWLLPKTHEALSACGLHLPDVELFAVAAGPGSFTGVRIGLTTVKAWSEAYGKPIAAVSRLEAIASQVSSCGSYVAAFVDAQRGQLFGGLYERHPYGFRLVEQEMAISPEGFLSWVNQRAAGQKVSWISLDPEMITSLDVWSGCAPAGMKVEKSTDLLAPRIGKLGQARAKEGRLTDALALDAEYVRRSDAEIFWKGAASGS